jgi:CDGSH-type Zn-finger protein
MPITIKVRQNGPLLIAGDDVAQVSLVDHEGTPISVEGRKSIALCRCGASTTKPFCDGTHSKIGFQGAEQARAEFDATKSGGGSSGGTGGATPAA